MTQYVGLEHSIPSSVSPRHDSNYRLIVLVHPSLVAIRCPCRDVGEVIPVASLRPIRTAHKTLGGRTLERPPCGGFVPTAETTLIPAKGQKYR